MKRLLGGSRHRQLRSPVQHSLAASGAVPTSESSVAADNFTGASRTAAELSKALEGVANWDELANDPIQGRNAMFRRLDEKAAVYTNTSLDFCPFVEQWDCEPAQAELIAAAWDCASNAYGPKGTTSTTGAEVTPVLAIEASSTGTTKATTGSIFTSQRSRSSYLIIAVRGSASDVDHVLNLHGEPKDTAALFDCDVYNNAKLSAHNGFLNVALELKRQLVPKIDNILTQNDYSNVLFTGHSAGGAVASLLHLSFQASAPSKYPRIAFSCITFGSPPYACAASSQDREVLSAALAGDGILHVINEYDIVARMDRPYIRSMIDLYNIQPSEQLLPRRWHTPEPELSHLGEIVVLKTRAPALDPDDPSLLPSAPTMTAWKVGCEELSSLLFCRQPVHHRTVYRDRVKQLEMGCFNGRSGWFPGPHNTAGETQQQFH